MKIGWVKIHRKMIGNSIFRDEYLLQLWIYILLSVNHGKTKMIFNGKEIILLPGSGIFGLNKIVSDLKNLNNPQHPKFKKFKTIYYRKLKLLEKLGNVKLQPTNKFTIISVVKWEEYQQDETQLKLKRNSTETQLKTNKNDKNDKNVKKETIYMELKKYLLEKIPPTLKPSKEYVLSFYKYRMKNKIKGKKQPYETTLGIDGLFRDLKNCVEEGYPVKSCCDVAKENGWLTPRVGYFDNINIKKVEIIKTPKEILAEAGLGIGR